jgi:hypothetical protein
MIPQYFILELIASFAAFPKEFTFPIPFRIPIFQSPYGFLSFTKSI